MYLFIHRKDLRLHDLPVLEGLVQQGHTSGIHLLILDSKLVPAAVESASHSFRTFIQQACKLKLLYEASGKRLHLLYGQPEEIVEALLELCPIRHLAVHEDYSPYSRQRDERLYEVASAQDVTWWTAQDRSLANLADFQLFAGRTEPYKVFTPFYRQWCRFMDHYFSPPSVGSVLQMDTAALLPSAANERFQLPERLHLMVADTMDKLMRQGHHAFGDPLSRLRSFTGGPMENYADHRNAFAVQGTSSLSRFLNSGTLSPREVYVEASCKPGSESWIRQLAWRDFYLYQAMPNSHFFSYENRYDLSGLSDDGFEVWSRAETGIPIIDAAMTQLLETGEMPNRLRMVTAMFLTKNLLCPFPVGEQFFRTHLADYDNALNRGGWLWSSSFGYDAAPYFRIMNPVSQSRTYDPNGDYIRQWLPDLRNCSAREIHEPRQHAVVDLKASRAQAIEVYRAILS